MSTAISNSPFRLLLICMLYLFVYPGLSAEDKSGSSCNFDRIRPSQWPIMDDVREGRKCYREISWHICLIIVICNKSVVWYTSVVQPRRHGPDFQQWWPQFIFWDSGVLVFCTMNCAKLRIWSPTQSPSSLGFWSDPKSKFSGTESPDPNP